MKRVGSYPGGIFTIILILLCFCGAPLQAQVNVTTYHNDNARTGQNLQETVLTPANVNSSQFGKLFSVSVDGWVYAQLLYLSNVNIGGGIHNVLFVATEHDSLYAIDAGIGTILWQVSLIPAGGSTVNSSTDLGCGDLVPEIGITGTPVIDPSTGTLYVVTKSKVNGSLVQYLHAIDVATAAEKFGGPVSIKASVPGTASDGNGTTVSFDPQLENQRPALLLENGHVVIGWSAHCDYTPFHGWIMSYAAGTLALEAALNVSANGSENGIWMSGGGPAADSNGNIFFATGNGSWNGTTDYGDSIVKLGPPSGGTFPVLDYFTPHNQSSLSGGDTDVASGGLVLLPNLPSGQQLLTQMGKEGTMYVIDRNNMGKYCVNQNPPCSGSDPNIVQEIPGATTGVWGTPAYWNGNIYWGGGKDGGGSDNLKAFSFNTNNSGLISASPTSKSSKAFSFSAPSPSISANGNANGILWGLDNSAFGSTCSGGSNCQVLYAYDATNLENMLYNSSQAANNRDVPGAAVKFAIPIIANGKVYVGSQFKVSAYGLIGSAPTAATPTFSPAVGTYSSAITVTLSDTTTGAAIHCTTDGITAPTASSPVCTTLQVTTTTTIKAIAVASGYNPSGLASGTFNITSSTASIGFAQVASATPQSSVASVKVAYPQAQIAGDLNLVVVGWNDTSTTVQSVTDSLGNPYALAAGPVKGTALSQSIYYAKNILGGSNSVTATFNKAAAFPDIRILEYKGLSTTAPLDVTAGASGTNGNNAGVNSGTVTTTSPSELIFGAATTSGGFSKAGTSFVTEVITPDGNIAENEVVSATGNYSATASLGAYGTQNWVMQMVALKGSGPSGTGGSAPTVASISPNSGSSSGGTAVTITGASFVAGAMVSIGGVAATNVTVASVTSITATTPAHAAGAVSVVVSDSNGSGTLTNGFNYTASAASIGFAQVASATPQSSVASVKVAYPQAQIAGDLNLVVVGWNDTSATVQSVTDSLGNSYALAAGPVKGTALTQSVYYAKNILAGSNSVTVAFNQAAAYPDIRILEYKGLSTTAPLDVTVGASGTNGNNAGVSSGIATTTSPSELIFGAATTSGGFSKAGTSFVTEVITPDGNIAENEVVSATGNYSATASLGAYGTQNWVMQMVGLKQ